MYTSLFVKRAVSVETLDFEDAGEGGFFFDFDEFQIFLSRGKTFVADVLVDYFGMDTVFKLMGDKSVAQIIDFGAF